MAFRKQQGTVLPFFALTLVHSFHQINFLTEPTANFPDAIVHFLWKRIENQIVALGLEQVALTVGVSRLSEADSPASFFHLLWTVEHST